MKTLYDRLKPEYKELLDNHTTWLALKGVALKGLQKEFVHDLGWYELSCLANVTKDFDFNSPYDLFL